LYDFIDRDSNPRFGEATVVAAHQFASFMGNSGLLKLEFFGSDEFFFELFSNFFSLFSPAPLFDI
jgi:hypothetical protein